MNKYRLDKTRMWKRGNHILYKIRYNEGFRNYIKESQGVDIDGGWLESEDNLSQDGECYVSNDGAVYDGARIFGTAIVRDRATVRGPESIFDEFIFDGDEYVVDILQRFEYDDDAEEMFTPIDDYDEMEVSDFHKHDLSPEELEKLHQEEAKFRREFDWDSLSAGAPDYDPDLDFLDDFEEDN